MTAVMPEIDVENFDIPSVSRPGVAGKIALIGAFDSGETNPLIFKKLTDAQEVLGTDTSFNGCKVLPKLFYGAESVLCVNTNVRTIVEEVTTDDKTMTIEKLTQALAKIKYEEFDTVFVAEEMTDAFIPILDAFCNEIYSSKNPTTYTMALTRANANAYITTKELIGEYCIGLVTQPGEVKGVAFDLLETAAFYTGVIATLNVGNSMTQKIIPDMTGLSLEYTFEDGDLGKTLVENGYTVFATLNRAENTYLVVNSEQPSGLDLYMIRSRNYIIRQMSLRQFLGDKNKPKTLEEVTQELDRVRDNAINTLDLVNDIEYTVSKTGANCVDIVIDSIKFPGVITKINVKIRVEVE